MFQKNAKKWMRAILVGTIITLIPVMAVSASDSRPTGSNYINTDGSTTLYPIMQLAQYQFPASNPGKAVINDSAPGTGSGHGRLALLSQVPIASANGGSNDPIDVAVASSACAAGDEFMVTNANFTEGTLTKSATASTVKCADLTDILVAKDAVTILVAQSKATCILGTAKPYIHKNMIMAIWNGMNYVDESTAPTGTAGATQHTWDQFWPGCGTENIVPTARIIGSGTRQSFFDLTGVTDANEQAEISATGLSRFQGNPQVESDISNNASHMGYTGLAFDNTKTSQLPVKFGTGSAVLPADANVANSSYPMSRVLHFYYKTSTTKQATRDLATWLWTSAAQGNIEKLGFVSIQKSTNPVNPGAQAPAPDWDVNADHSASVLDVTSIGAYFGQTGPASGDPNFANIRGWVRADINYDAQVNVLDITTFGPHFGQSW